MDVVGYSRLMRVDEEGTMAVLISLRELIDAQILEFGGRMFGSAGDSVLAEFASPVEAVRCALEIQKKTATFNSERLEDQKMLLRVGVNLGDIIENDGALYGDGINVAARLETVCEPNGVCVSDAVHNLVQNRMNEFFSDIGEQTFKNIDEPLRVWMWTALRPTSDAKQGKAIFLPSVAVLPFKNISSDTEQDYFADGIVEEIITALSGFPGMIVIARNSSFSFKGQSIDVRRIGQELNARYILEGSVRKSGERLRIMAQLADAETGVQLWANRFDGVLEDVFDLQDAISEAVVGAIAPEIQNAEIVREMRKAPKNLDSYDCYLRGLNDVHRGELGNADNWFGKAIEAAPDYARAMARKAWIGTAWRNYGKDAVGDYRQECLKLAKVAVALQPDNPEVAAYAGYTIGFLSASPSAGLAHVNRATRLCPCFAWAWASSALLNVYLGDADVSLEHAETARRLSPKDPMAFRTYSATGLANIIKEDARALLASSEIGISLSPELPGFRYHRAIALIALGRILEAAEERAVLLELKPEFTISEFIRSSREDIGMSDLLLGPVEDGLRKVGFPE
ncbi:adenylate/guanylate cyclase domain-containing protein [Shimia sp.]|uniref:adenylate/guanylate cyclase domain-containing protein n=1 Tax=Shimia sp. TaxID=1954381 RepID=UPI003296C720